MATTIVYNGLKLFCENLSLLLGRSPGSEYLANVERLALSVPGVLGVHDLRAEYIGPDMVHAGMHVVVQRGLPIKEADRIAEEVSRRIHETGELGYCIIHVDAAEAEIVSKKVEVKVK